MSEHTESVERLTNEGVALLYRRAINAEQQVKAAHRALDNLHIDATKPCERCGGKTYLETSVGKYGMKEYDADCPAACFDNDPPGQVPCSLEERIEMLGERLREAERFLAGPVHGMLQAARGKCADERPYEEIDVYLQRIDLRVSEARSALAPENPEGR